MGWFYLNVYQPGIYVKVRVMASQITGVSIVYSTAGSSTDERKHQTSASLAFVRGIYRWSVNCPHKRQVTRKIFPFDDVIMLFGTRLESTQEWVPQILPSVVFRARWATWRKHFKQDFVEKNQGLKFPNITIPFVYLDCTRTQWYFLKCDYNISTYEV